MKKKNEFISVEDVISKEDAEKEMKKIARREAKIRVRKYMNTLDDGSEIKNDLLFLIGKETIGRPEGKATNQKVLAFMIMHKEQGVTETELFEKFKIGRPEMKVKIRAFIKMDPTRSRVWIKLFKDDETYRIVGLGENTPKDWKGYLPSGK